MSSTRKTCWAITGNLHAFVCVSLRPRSSLRYTPSLGSGHVAGGTPSRRCTNGFWKGETLTNAVRQAEHLRAEWEEEKKLDPKD